MPFLDVEALHVAEARSSVCLSIEIAVCVSLELKCAKKEIAMDPCLWPRLNPLRSAALMTEGGPILASSG